ncbi:MAG TPA: septum formation initiator family protein [Dehalococcoidia bacterium]|nr:septum formation initiator family protein [Dehalococcoidia bacterium]
MFRLFSPGRLILIATLGVGAYLFVDAGHNLLNSYHLVNDESRLQSEVDGLQTQLDELQQVRDYLRTDDYVEYMARRVFGLVLPGETLVVVDAPTPEAQNQEDDTRTWWQRLFGNDSGP